MFMLTGFLSSSSAPSWYLMNLNCNKTTTSQFQVAFIAILIHMDYGLIIKSISSELKPNSLAETTISLEKPQVYQISRNVRVISQKFE